MSSARGWEPITDDAEDSVTARAAAALHGLLDADGPPPGPGDPLPPLWHWLAFLPSAPQHELGSDGHPSLGGFLPPVAFGRRMFAGGRLDFKDAVTVEGALRKRSVVTSVTEKSGRSGQLVFVEVTHELSERATPAITEVQDLVYRDIRPRTVVPEAPEPQDDTDWDWGFALQTDPALLFRFSALTYNAHRIHYDRTYATEVEGYPGLVVHGPLQAIALAEICRRHLPDRRMLSFNFRALRPAFAGPVLRLRGRQVADGRIELAAVNDRGHPTMTAEADLAS